MRDVLVFALAHDENADVRARAMAGLRGYAHDPAVQNALARVLLSDASSGVRTQAIDILMSRQGPELDRQIVGALQELMGRENDRDVRQRCQRILQSIKASAEIY